MKKLVVFFSLLFISNISASSKNKVLDIQIIGNKKTKKSTILKELTFKKGDEANQEDIRESIANLKNLNVFYNISAKIKQRPNGRTIVFSLQERWTTIPIIKFSSGGGVSQTTLGVYDPNSFGRLLELGAQIEKLDESYSGVAWFKKPRFFNTNLGVELQLWKTNRLRVKYDKTLDDPVATTGFLQTRDKAFLKISKAVKSDLNFSVSYEFNKDKFSNKLVPQNIVFTTAEADLPPPSTFHLFGLGFDLGRVDLNSYLIEGSKISAQARYALSGEEDIDNFFNVDLSFNFYKTIFKNHTFAQKISLGGTNTKILQYWYYLGGLDKIRGFVDNRFAGRYFWTSNTEYRIAFWQNDYLILQGSTFLDLVGTAEQFKSLSSLTGASAGGGIRFIFPKIYRSNIRLDYAKTLVKNGEHSISFGLQQFF